MTTKERTLFDREDSHGVPTRKNERKQASVPFMNKLKAAFALPQLPGEAQEPTDKEIARRVVRARSHGNIRLQYGRYYTQADLDEQYDRVRKLDFTPQSS